MLRFCRARTVPYRAGMSGGANGVKRMKIAELFHDPRKSLLGQLTVYYIALMITVWQLTRWFPSLSAYIYSWEDRERDVVGDEVFETLG